MTNGQDSQVVFLKTQPVELYKILKFEGLVASGGQAKVAIDDGLVRVNGAIETRRRRKIISGDTIEMDNVCLRMELADNSES